MSPAGRPETLTEWGEFYVEHADEIFVRHEGKSRALSELPAKAALGVVFCWLVEHAAREDQKK